MAASGHINLDMSHIAGTATNLSRPDVDPDAVAASAVAAVHEARATAGITSEWRHSGHGLTAEQVANAGRSKQAAQGPTREHEAKAVSSVLLTRHGQPLSTGRKKLAVAAFAECHLAAANFPSCCYIRNRLKTLASGRSTNRFIDGGSHSAIGAVLKAGTYRVQLPEQFELFQHNLQAHPDVGPLHCSQFVAALDAGLFSGAPFRTANKRLEERNGELKRAEMEPLRAVVGVCARLLLCFEWRRSSIGDFSLGLCVRLLLCLE